VDPTGLFEVWAQWIEDETYRYKFVFKSSHKPLSITTLSGLAATLDWVAQKVVLIYKIARLIQKAAVLTAEKIGKALFIGEANSYRAINEGMDLKAVTVKEQMAESKDMARAIAQEYLFDKEFSKVYAAHTGDEKALDPKNKFDPYSGSTEGWMTEEQAKDALALFRAESNINPDIKKIVEEGDLILDEDLIELAKMKADEAFVTQAGQELEESVEEQLQNLGKEDSEK
jgi:hypothetical protein